ncbi:hypothetical protein NL676_009498 [Syzygium grande]|nr:hypothetical protein NL676_009498 [Syzygium grande]
MPRRPQRASHKQGRGLAIPTRARARLCDARSGRWWDVTRLLRSRSFSLPHSSPDLSRRSGHPRSRITSSLGLGSSAATSTRGSVGAPQPRPRGGFHRVERSSAQPESTQSSSSSSNSDIVRLGTESRGGGGGGECNQETIGGGGTEDAERGRRDSNGETEARSGGAAASFAEGERGESSLV